MATLCAGTPKISVRDNRGLDIRTLRYNRTVDGAVAMQYVDAQTRNALGQPATSQDPRFFGSQTLNFQNTLALSGQILEAVSADAGTSKACTDIAGQPIWQYSEGRDTNLPSDKAITVQMSYDALGRPVQRACYTADVSGGGSLGGLTDIWSYGDYSGLPDATYYPTNASDPRNANQRGRVFQQFDTAGLIDMSVLGYAVQATALRQDRRFQATPCDATTHWKAGTPQALYGLNKQWLESDTDPANLYSTRWAYNALSQILTQVDAKGHQQQIAYDCAGRKFTASVTPKGGTLIPVCAGITYNAAGAIDTRSDANNIQIAYVHEPQTTQRLISLTASRSVAAGNDSKSHRAKHVRASSTLQALTYAYDGVGNVTSSSDSSASALVSFLRNRAVTPDRGYTYDALYQLTSATGRENYVNNTPKGTDWPGGQFSPASTPEYQAYTRSYTYDPGGNLTTIRSSNWSGAAPPTRQLVVSNGSNRAVSTTNSAGATQANIDTYFDLAGKSICLDANRNQPMYWTAFHQLYCVVTTYRPPTSSGVTGDWFNCDREQYAYDGNGQRVRKYASSMASNQAGGIWNILDTRYLPGLELRDNSASGENLEVIILDDGARILNWVGGTGKPSDIPNQQLRYQYNDRQNSCRIETDSDGNVITREEYYPYGGTAVLASRSNSEVKYKYIRYCGKERDATGLYYYGMRYYQAWIGRWLNPDPSGTVDGQNLYCMVRNNPTSLTDATGLSGGRPGTEDEDSSSDEELSALAVDTDLSWSMAGLSSASPAASQYSVSSLASTPRKRPQFSPASVDQPPTKKLNNAEQLHIDAWNRVVRSMRQDPLMVTGLAKSENGRAVFSRTPELEQQVRDLHSRSSIGSIADAPEIRHAQDYEILKIAEGAGAEVLRRQRNTDAALDGIRADQDQVRAEIANLDIQISNRQKQNSSYSVKDLQQKKAAQVMKLKELTCNARMRQNESSSHWKAFSTPFNKRISLNNEAQQRAFRANLSEAFQTAASAENRKGLAFATFGTANRFYFLGITVNIPKNPKDFETYKNKAVRNSWGRVNFNEKFEPWELDAHFAELDRHLVDYGYSPLHPYTKYRIAQFNKTPTVREDLHINDVFHGPRQHPPNAGVPGTHAESILFNELIHNFFPVSQNIGFDQIERESASLLSKNLRIFTLRLLKPGPNGFEIFPPCVGCQAIIGSAINDRNGPKSMARKSAERVIAELTKLNFLENKQAIRAHLGSKPKPDPNFNRTVWK